MLLYASFTQALRYSVKLAFGQFARVINVPTLLILYFKSSIGKFLYFFHVLPIKKCSTFVKFLHKRLVSLRLFSMTARKKKFIKLYRTSSVAEDPMGSLVKVKIFLVVHCGDLFYEMYLKVL